MKILVINSGSSSVKYQLFDITRCKVLNKGIVERVKDHHKAIEEVFRRLPHDKVSGIGHRVVHGAEEFTKPTIINDKVIATIKKFNTLAPLHNPPALAGILACKKIAKGIPQVAVFDTAFHQTIPQRAYIYGIPYEFYKNFKIRRYGFHGTSHKYVAQQAAKKLGKGLKNLKIVTCHLGNGCSITAVKNGRSVDTSMGFTPLEGLLMGTRSGDIDPAVVLYIMEKKNFSAKQMDGLLNKRSGFLGLSGISNDMRDILKAAKKGSLRARLTLDIFIYKLKKYIGAYTAAMDGLDAIVFTAGIGENVPAIRNAMAKEMKEFLHHFKTKILVIPTNEELMIAHETAQTLRPRKKR